FSEWQNELLEEEGEENEGLRQGISRPAADLIFPFEIDPAELSNISVHRYSPESTALALDKRLIERIEEISHHLPSSVSGFFLACWQILLWLHGGEEEIVIECLFDGRQFEELHDALGLFARYVPTHGTLGRGLRFDEVVERAVKSLSHAYASQELYLREMASPKAAKLSHAIGFEFEEWPRPESAGPVKFKYWRQYCCLQQFKLKLGGYRKADGLTIELQYDPKIFSQESAELILERYLKLIECAVDRGQMLIGNLEIADRKVVEIIRPSERQQEPLLAREPRNERLPLSFAQQRLWFLDQLAPGNALYNMSGGLRLEGRLDLEALERAINEIVRRHEVLRTRFEVEAGEPVQVVAPWQP